MELIIFSILSFFTLFFSLMTILSRTPVYSLLYTIGCFIGIAGHYLFLHAEFLAIVQIIVYAGAIMVLFLFTLMLLNLNEKSEIQKPILTRLIAVITSGSFLYMLIIGVQKSKFIIPTLNYDSKLGDVKNLGKILLNEYMFPFEYISLLLLSAMIGAVLLTKKEKIIVK